MIVMSNKPYLYTQVGEDHDATDLEYFVWRTREGDVWSVPKGILVASLNSTESGGEDFEPWGNGVGGLLLTEGNVRAFVFLPRHLVTEFPLEQTNYVLTETPLKELIAMSWLAY